MVMFYTKGGMGVKELENISFDEFQMYVKEASRIQDMINKPPEGING